MAQVAAIMELIKRGTKEINEAVVMAAARMITAYEDFIMARPKEVYTKSEVRDLLVEIRTEIDRIRNVKV